MGLVVLVGVEIAARIDRQPGAFQRQSLDGPAPPGCKQRRFRFHHPPRRERHAHSGFGASGGLRPLLKTKPQPEAREAGAEQFGDFPVQERKQALAAVHEGHVDAQRGEDRRILAADHAAAHYDHALGDAAAPTWRDDTAGRTTIFVRQPPRQLLNYLVEHTLAGDVDKITEYAIGLDVFQKPTSFDPRIESVVRTEFSRLRQRLKEYYAEDGRRDSIAIDFPPRSYAASFEFRDPSRALRSRRVP